LAAAIQVRKPSIEEDMKQQILSPLRTPAAWKAAATRSESLSTSPMEDVWPAISTRMVSPWVAARSRNRAGIVSHAA
jgi:hypothetical protein